MIVHRSTLRGKKVVAFAAALFCTILSVPATAQVEINSNTFGGLEARALGPSTMSGRISSLDVAVNPDGGPLTVWVGAASGGVWKSENEGLTFEPVFDDHPQSIGVVRVDPSNHETIWVGTGEPWVRNSVSVGFGVYKSTDDGDSWNLVGEDAGLSKTERISTIRIDPTDGDVVYVCATGALWNANEDRGLYKTIDGGETWEKILYVDENTGCADIDIDPQEPNIIYAGMWQFRRYPDFFESGGPGSGFYRSDDGGETWTEITTDHGMPEGELGRIAVAVAPSRPSTVYATVEAEETGLYRSDDSGTTWKLVSTSQNVTTRPFYFSELIVDPTDHRRIFRPGLFLFVSEDGGESFSGFLGAINASVHPDHHALWINPENSHEMFLGTDGGLYISRDRGKNYLHVKSLPISQFYRAMHDMEWPYNVYGGLQDNGTWYGPSRKFGGIGSADWKNLSYGDGFWALPDPRNANRVYTEYQGGQLYHVNRELNELQKLRPYPRDDEEDLRFNWNTPMHLSPSNPDVLYYGSQYLHRSGDGGLSWTTISPDLTTDDPQRQRQQDSGGLTKDNSTAENNATIYSISESPNDSQVIWVGTDDGYVQLTRDGGETWTNVVENIDVPENTWVSSVFASPHSTAHAFVTFDGHRTGDMGVYVFKTEDFGGSWTSLVTDEIEGYAWIIKQDPVNGDLLYLGTEMGLWITLDGGNQWARFKGNMPRVAVHDINVHPTEHDLIVGTHGRGIYILDDLTPLRAMTQETLDSDVALLPTRPAVMPVSSAVAGSDGNADYVAPSPPEAASIVYYLKKRHLFGDLRVEIYDGDELVKSIPATKRKGLNRVQWEMRGKAPTLPPATALVPAFAGPRVSEGKYTVRLIKGKKTVEGEIELIADPRTPHSAEDRALQQKTAMALYDHLGELTYLVTQATELRDGARAAEGLRKGDAAKVDAFADKVDALIGEMAAQKAAYAVDDVQLRERLGNLYGDIVGYDGRPSDTQLERLDALGKEMEEAATKLEKMLSGDLPAVNSVLTKRGKTALEPLSREAWEAREDGGGASSGTVSVKQLKRHVLPMWMSTLAGM